MSVEIIVAVIVGAFSLSVVLIKKFYNPNLGTNQDIVDKTSTQKDVEHVQFRLEIIEKDIEKLYDADMVQHAEKDKIMGIITEIKLMVAKL